MYDQGTTYCTINMPFKTCWEYLQVFTSGHPESIEEAMLNRTLNHTTKYSRAWKLVISISLVEKIPYALTGEYHVPMVYAVL
ncbi:hypothetical protein TNCT_370161 [Trichonephila clavata]|uniref:Uncharacterized protein n=1 Tax=Trichonephila clavata TaxID=2740835 RepID=A0A8X6KG38_TRICU|nr:hypothetical protein TNCT_370161 [Trichonephila clavata]